MTWGRLLFVHPGILTNNYIYLREIMRKYAEANMEPNECLMCMLFDRENNSCCQSTPSIKSIK